LNDYSDVSDKNNYYTNEHFQQRLILERRRAERFDTQASIIIFNIVKSTLDSPNQKNYVKRIKNLLKIFCLNVRETDAVSIFNNEKIIILLPDTNIKDAQYVSKILLEETAIVAGQKNGVEILNSSNFDVEILPFPDKNNDKKLPHHAPLGIVTPFSYPDAAKRHTNYQASDVSKYSQNYYRNLKANSNFTGASALVMQIENTPFFDRQFLKDLLVVLQKSGKRMMDVSGSLALLIILSPLLMLIGIAIRLTSSGHAIYKQIRVGQNGREFKILKFRSMFKNTGKKSHQDFIQKLIRGENHNINNGTNEIPQYKMKDDPRVTPIGKFLRRTSLDELPQLWNVLRGEMSLVGPRPPIPYEVEAYRTWHYRRIIEFKPGMTGLWQIKGRNTTTFDEMVRLDIDYIKNWSLPIDLIILVKTVSVLVNPTGI